MIDRFQDVEREKEDYPEVPVDVDDNWELDLEPPRTFYSVLAPTGTNPFTNSDFTDPLSQLRVSENCELIEFEHQPTQVISARYATAYGYILWPATTINFHEDDFENRVEIETVQDFQGYLDYKEQEAERIHDAKS